MNPPSERPTRRRVLVAFGGGATAALCGCLGTSDEPTYRAGRVDEAGGDPRTAEEMAAAEALATTEENENASTLESLVLENHEFAITDGYKGPTVRGGVSNTSDERVAFAEVRVRVYGAEGAQIGRYLDDTGDIEPGTKWRFEVILLDSAADIADYDIAVLGVPD